MVYLQLRDDITCNYISLKRKCHGVFTSFVKNGETRSSLQLQNDSRTTRGKKSTQFLKRTTNNLSQRILETKIRELEKR